MLLSRHTRRRDLVLAAGAIVAVPLAVRAAQVPLPVLGFLGSRSPEGSEGLLVAFRQGLKDSGYIEGQTLMIEYRWALGQYDRLPVLAAELVARKVAIIVATGGEPAALAAQAATSTIPIVFGIGGDPVRLGLVADLRRPGGNATGVSLLTSTLEAKRLELLRELAPKAAEIAVLVNPEFQQAKAQAQEIESAARTTGQKVLLLKASTDTELDAALARLGDRRAQALLVTSDPFFDTRLDRILMAVAQNRLPAIYQFRDHAVAGGLMSYGIDLTDAYRQFGLYAGRILKGANPAELPVMQSAKFELVINLKTAKMLRLDVPPSLLARANEVIE
jgi:putative ABC transport system substrate-binding protein